jgi:hypothetical protein
VRVKVFAGLSLIGGDRNGLAPDPHGTIGRRRAVVNRLR